jgi:Flp pilus assembly protein protease CpaA
MLDIILITIAFIVLLIASYIDIRTREVPDWLNYGLLFAAFGIRIIFSFEMGWGVILSGMLGFIVCLAFAFLFYYTSQWGGGDSKLLMGMGAIIGITYPFNNGSWNLLFFFLALLFLGAIYGLIFMVAVAIRKRASFTKEFLKSIKKKNKLHLFMIILTLVFSTLTLLKTYLWPLILFPLLMFYLFIFVNVVEKTCFFKRIKVEHVTEGDWLAEDVKVKKKTIVEARTLEKDDVWKLRTLAVKGKIEDVLIKEGVPFVPSFLFAYTLLIFGGEFVAWILGFLL